jgi:Complex I intermediate-associated protein 30 (CIA30)
LDITALGGAGFSSQRTTSVEQIWDLSSFDAIYLDLCDSSSLFCPLGVPCCISSQDLTYTFVLKDTLLPPNPDNGREQSTVSWEYDFQPREVKGGVNMRFKDFRPFYRGKPKNDSDPLKLGSIKRFNIMIRR